jgi:hypothetical protein
VCHIVFVLSWHTNLLSALLLRKVTLLVHHSTLEVWLYVIKVLPVGWCVIIIQIREQSSSWQANKFSLSQHSLPNVHYRIYNSPLPVPNPSQIDPVRPRSPPPFPPSHSYKFRFDIFPSTPESYQVGYQYVGNYFGFFLRFVVVSSM